MNRILCIDDELLILQIQQLILNLQNYEFFVSNNSVKLTNKEVKMLILFMKNPNRIYSREQLITLIWEDKEDLTQRAVDVYISRMRKTLKDNDCDLLETIRGLDYRLNTK